MLIRRTLGVSLSIGLASALGVERIQAESPAARPVVAVFDIEDARRTGRLPPEALSDLTDYLATRLAEARTYQLVPRSQIRDALSRQKADSHRQCFDQACQIDIGKAFAAQKTLGTKVVRLGGKSCAVTSTLYDLRTEVTEAGATAEAACDQDALVGALKVVVGKLLGEGVAPRPAPGGKAGETKDDDYEAYGKLAATAEEADRRAEEEKRRRSERIDRAWLAVEKFARSESIKPKERIAALKKFLAEFNEGNIHTTDAEALLQQIELGGRVEMITIPGGEFYSGCNEAVDSECQAAEKPGKRISLPTFKIDKIEVTVAEFKRCVDAGACSAQGATVPYWTFDSKEHPELGWACNWGASGRERHPMNCVDWPTAQAYCTWVGKRLPRDEEWEKAARGTDGRKFPWGNQGFIPGGTRWANVADEQVKRNMSTWEVASGFDDGFYGTAPIGSFAQGASPYGVLDMTGNVCEWTSGGSESWRPTRGGAWSSQPPRQRISAVEGQGPSARTESIGFRCAQ